MLLLMRIWKIVRSIPMLVACLMAGSGGALAIVYVILRCGFGFNPYEDTLMNTKGAALFLSVFSITPWLLGISFNFPTWTTAKWLKWEWSRWDWNTRFMGIYGICVPLFVIGVTADIALP